MSLSRHAIRAGSEAHYLDPSYYDQIYRRRRQDVHFYVDEAVRRRRPAVLELGAGTGRVTVALARAGVPVVGVEKMRPMLTQAKRGVAKLPQAERDLITLRTGDLRRMRLRRRFPLIIAAFNVFMHLYSRKDWEQALATVRTHLAPRGRLVFDVLLPDPDELSRKPGREYRAPPLRHPSDGLVYDYREVFDYDPRTQVQLVEMMFTAQQDPRQRFVMPLTQRQVFPAELEALLHYNGFKIEAHFGGFDRTPLTRDSESQVVIAKRR